MFGKIWVSGNCCAIYFANIKRKKNHQCTLHAVLLLQVNSVGHHMLLGQYRTSANTVYTPLTGGTHSVASLQMVWAWQKWQDYSVYSTVCILQCTVCSVQSRYIYYSVLHTCQPYCTSAKTDWEAEYNGRRRGGVFWLDFILVVSVKNYRLVLCGELTSLLCEDFSRKVKPDYSYYCKRRADLKKRF